MWLRVFIAFFGIYIIWGSTYFAIKITLETMPPLLTSGLRFVIAGLILFIAANGFKKFAEIKRQHVMSAIIIGALMILGGNGNVVLAERTVPSGIAALVISTIPLWMALIQWCWNPRQRPSMISLIGILLGFIGVAGLLLPAGSQTHDLHLGGMVHLIIAALLWSLGSLLTRTLSQHESIFIATSMQMVLGGLTMMLAGIVMGEWGNIHWAQMSGRSIGAFFYLSIFGSLWGFTSYIWLLKHVGPLKVATYPFVNPIVAIIIGSLLANEAISGRVWIASAIILVAVALIIADGFFKKGQDVKG